MIGFGDPWGGGVSPWGGGGWSPYTSAITATPLWAGVGAFGGGYGAGGYGFSGYGFGSMNPFYASLGFANTLGFWMPSFFAPSYPSYPYPPRAAYAQGWNPPYTNPAAAAAPTAPQPAPPPAAAAPQGTADWTAPKRDDEWAQKEGDGADAAKGGAEKTPGKRTGTAKEKPVGTTARTGSIDVAKVTAAVMAKNTQWALTDRTAGTSSPLVAAFDDGTKNITIKVNNESMRSIAVAMKGKWETEFAGISVTVQ
ncbi:MAG: hypothetical protein HY696_00755 [Deltaproteobacteria bacterium]|nr:hypothetical protein [Deltaproteobacteria bacterium]